MSAMTPAGRTNRPNMGGIPPDDPDPADSGVPERPTPQPAGEGPVLTQQTEDQSQGEGPDVKDDDTEDSET
jgi:hypothetical protein